MILNNNYLRSLKGITTDMMRGMRSMLAIIFVILAVIPVINMVTAAVAHAQNPNTSMNASSGILTVGFMTAVISLSIAMFSSTANADMGRHFKWPVNRPVYAVGSFLTMVFTAVVLMSGVSLLLTVEMASIEIIRMMFDDIIFINGITFANYITGLWTSISYIVLMASLAYCTGMYFFRNYKIGIAVLTLLTLLTINPIVRSIYSDIIMFFAGENSIALFSIKAWAAVLLLNALAYIPLKRLEVKV